jgi:hypothetical protein
MRGTSHTTIPRTCLSDACHEPASGACDVNRRLIVCCVALAVPLDAGCLLSARPALCRRRSLLPGYSSAAPGALPHARAAMARHGMAWHGMAYGRCHGGQRQAAPGRGRVEKRAVAVGGGCQSLVFNKRAARVRARARARSAIRHGWVFVTVHGLALHGPSRVTVWSLTTTTQHQPAASQRVFARLHRHPAASPSIALRTSQSLQWQQVGSASSTCQQPAWHGMAYQHSQPKPEPTSIHPPPISHPTPPPPLPRQSACQLRAQKPENSTHPWPRTTKTHLAHPAPSGSLNELDGRYETAHLPNSIPQHIA